jgi:PAS domain S-box-containing protein/putative nucleotidyltransferase with HDIG domain
MRLPGYPKAGSSQEWFLALVQHSSDLMIVIDEAGVLVYANPAASVMFGIATNAAIGRSAYDYIHPDDVERIAQNLAALRGTPGSPRTETLRVVSAGGEVRILEVVATNCLHIPAVAGVVINGRDVTERNRYFTQLAASFDAVVHALANAVELRDPYTAGHQREVSEIAGNIARELRLPDDEVRGIEVAGTLHDVGKIAIPAEILTRPGRLSPPELEIIKTHAEAGCHIVGEIPFPWPVATMILQHHERIDGSGYPKGLEGSDILLGARILSVADVISAMSEHRPYRSGLGLSSALVELETNRGRLFDAGVVDACLRLFADGRLLATPRATGVPHEICH